MAPRDPCLARINRALRDLGSSISLEIGGRLRLRASLPTPDGGKIGSVSSPASWCPP